MSEVECPDTQAERLLGTSAPPSEQKVLDAMVTKARNGVDRVTAGELRDLLEQTHAPRRFDKGWVTGRLDTLRKRGLVEQSEDHRLDPLTKKWSVLWFLPLHQARLCA